MSDTTLSVSCPTCKKPVNWSEHSEHRPFCSERCQLVDLGEWSSEGYSIPDKEQHIDEFSEDGEAPQCH